MSVDIGTVATWNTDDARVRRAPAREGAAVSEFYIVLHEWGSYDDWHMVVAGVFAKLDDAERYIRRHGRTVTLCRDGSYAELCDFDDVDAIGTVTIAPVESQATRALFNDKTVGGGWYIPHDPSYDKDSWHIERWEVQR